MNIAGQSSRVSSQPPFAARMQAIMTALMYLAPAMGIPKMDMLGMMGTMFTAKPEPAMIIGTLFHFTMGVIFALIYTWLWSVGIGAATWLWGLIFGAVHGVVAVGVMPVMLGMHPRPPKMETGPMMAVGAIMRHLSSVWCWRSSTAPTCEN